MSASPGEETSDDLPEGAGFGWWKQPVAHKMKEMIRHGSLSVMRVESEGLKYD